MKLIKQDNGKWTVTDMPSDLVLELHDYIFPAKGAKEITSLEKVYKNGRKHKKHNFIKVCPKCGKECKGIGGLGTHMGHKHHKKELLPAVNELSANS